MIQYARELITVQDATGNAPVAYAETGAAGFDIAATEEVTIPPGDCRAVGTGLFVRRVPNPLFLGTTTFDEVMPGLSIEFVPEIQIRPRSGLALKKSVSVCNAPGTVDVSFPNEIKVILINHGQETFEVKVGDRIAQGVVAFTMRAPFVPVTDATRTGGFGSTGT